MDNLQYIKVNVLKWIVQAIPESSSGDTITAEIRRLSDGYTWNFTNLLFQNASNSGNMTFVSDIIWKQSFTPPTADTYIVTITDSTRDVKYVQVLQATTTTAASVVVDEVAGSDAASMLNAVNQAISARLNGGAVNSYSIGGRELQYISLKELLDLRSQLQKEIGATKTGTRTYAQFKRPS